MTTHCEHGREMVHACIDCERVGPGVAYQAAMFDPAPMDLRVSIQHTEWDVPRRLQAKIEALKAERDAILIKHHARKLKMRARIAELTTEVEAQRRGARQYPTIRRILENMTATLKEVRAENKTLRSDLAAEKEAGPGALNACQELDVAISLAQTSVVLKAAESAIASAGFRVAPDYHGAPTLWCIECGRDSGMHWAPCEKVKRDIERANDALVAEIADAMLDFEEGTAGVYVRQRWGADKA